MTCETLDRKILQPGATLSLIKYQLTNEEAEALHRPIGSSELVLDLQSKFGNDSTPPEASRYLNENYYREIFKSIRHELHYRNVGRVLEKVKDEESAEQVRKKGIFIITTGFSRELLERLK